MKLGYIRRTKQKINPCIKISNTQQQPSIRFDSLNNNHKKKIKKIWELTGTFIARTILHIQISFYDFFFLVPQKCCVAFFAYWSFNYRGCWHQTSNRSSFKGLKCVKLQGLGYVSCLLRWSSHFSGPFSEVEPWFPDPVATIVVQDNTINSW